MPTISSSRQPVPDQISQHWCSGGIFMSQVRESDVCHLVTLRLESHRHREIFWWLFKNIIINEEITKTLFLQIFGHATFIKQQVEDDTVQFTWYPSFTYKGFSANDKQQNMTS